MLRVLLNHYEAILVPWKSVFTRAPMKDAAFQAFAHTPDIHPLVLRCNRVAIPA